MNINTPPSNPDVTTKHTPLQSTFAKVSYWTINTHARPEHFRQRTRIHAHIVTMLQFLNTKVDMWCFRSNTKVRHCLQCGSWYLCSRLVICPTSQRVICTNQDFTTALYNVCTDMTNESTVLILLASYWSIPSHARQTNYWVMSPPDGITLR